MTRCRSVRGAGASFAALHALIETELERADPDRAAQILRRLMDAIPPTRPAGLTKEDARVSDTEIARAIDQGRVGIKMQLEQTP